MVNVCIDAISHVCTDMDGSDGESQRECLISGDLDISLETSPPSQIFCTQESDPNDRSDSPTTTPRPSVDIPRIQLLSPHEETTLLRRTLIGVGPTTGYPSLASTQASRICNVI